MSRQYNSSLEIPRKGSVRRIAKVMLHTSPLDQAGVGDAGGMNTYVIESAKKMAAAGFEVDIFTRASSRDLPDAVELAPGVRVRHLHAQPYEGVSKSDNKTSK